LRNTWFIVTQTDLKSQGVGGGGIDYEKEKVRRGTAIPLRTKQKYLKSIVANRA
jgi:hypothetical protein